MFTSKVSSLTICFVIYLLAFYFSFILLPETINNIWLKITIWHIYATLFVYFGSLILKNSSLYDPFWSVAPVPIVIYLAVKSDNSITLDLLVLFPIINSGIDGTYILNKKSKPVIRALKTDLTKDIDEKGEMDMTALMNIKDLYFGGDMEAAPALSGQSSGLIDEIKPVKQIIDEIVKEFNSICDSMSELKI